MNRGVEQNRGAAANLDRAAVGPVRLIVLGLASWVAVSGIPAAGRAATTGSPPLSQVVKTSAKACQAAVVTRVPLITWGGDIATIFANGNAKKTRAGSLFQQQGLSLELVREDVFARQVESYLKCESPYLRGTLGMVSMAAEVTSKSPGTEMVPIYQITWSAGGDALVVKSGIKSPKDLRGKTIAVQAYGPHVDYLTTVLKDAGLGTSDVKLRWVEDLVGFEGKTPSAAFHDASVDAAFVIIPDALALTSNGTVGTGAEDSVKGATILLSTKTANRVIADLYMVRRDYLKANPKKVEGFVHALMLADEALGELVAKRKSRASEYEEVIGAAAEILLDSKQATADAEGMYADAEFVGYAGNVRFFTDKSYPRGLARLTKEVQDAFVTLGLLGRSIPLQAPPLDYASLKRGLRNTAGVEAPRFDEKAVAQVVTRKQQQGTLGEGELFAFEVYFQPNQNDFAADQYADAFNQVMELASTYGGAIITVEGHSDPLGFLRARKEGEQEVVLRRMQQAAKNLSLARANAVRDSVVSYSKGRDVTLDSSQFAIVGHGIGKPKSGLCGRDPCAPKSEQEWRDNMRVEFRIIQVEAEASVFKPL